MKKHYGQKDFPSVLFLLWGIVLSSFFSQRVFAQANYEYGHHVITAGDTLKYRYLTPECLRPGKKYPLVLFLHGSGERGSDNETQLKHGGGVFLNPVTQEKHPAFVLFPQCAQGEFGPFAEEPSSFDGASLPVDSPISPFMIRVKSLLDDYISRPEVDKNRIYVVGLSMGAMGVYDLVCRFPDLFAAAIPICGSVNVERLPKKCKVHFRIFHGENDEAVPVECSRSVYRALKQNKSDVTYLEFYGCNHLSWNPAFNLSDFTDWLFRQKK